MRVLLSFRTNLYVVLRYSCIAGAHNGATEDFRELDKETRLHDTPHRKFEIFHICSCFLSMVDGKEERTEGAYDSLNVCRFANGRETCAQGMFICATTSHKSGRRFCKKLPKKEEASSKNKVDFSLKRNNFSANGVAPNTFL